MAHLKLKSKTVTSYSMLYIFFILINNAYGALQEEEINYMMKLRGALKPTPPTWSKNRTDICNWKGVNCLLDVAIEGIHLGSMSLKGEIPSGLNESLLTLTDLDLSNNSLSGPIPNLTNLFYLQDVILDNNNFTSIPDGCFQGLRGLMELTLSNNTNLKPWEFPLDLNESSALSLLALSSTNLIGSLPDNFAPFTNLRVLFLSNNSLTGVLPKTFANSHLQVLTLDNQSGDKLSGTIQVLSSMNDLQEVWLDGNRFEGPIPDLSNCTKLDSLHLEHNLLTGVVPYSLINMSSLSEVSLDHNYLQGPFPVFNDSCTVSVGNNTSNSNRFCLDKEGTCDQRVTTLLEIAAGFGYPIVLARSWRGNDPCKGWRFITCDGSNITITTINMTNLNLTGNISAAFAKLRDLQNLYLSHNNLSGPIPKDLETLSQLKVVDVSYNNLSGNNPRFSHPVEFNATGNKFLRDPQAHRIPTWVAAAAAPVVALGVIMTVIVIIYNRTRRHRTMMLDKDVEDFIKCYGFLAPKRYSYSEVKKMTNSFRDKLGQGGYGSVFKATLSDGRHVAVKVLSESKGSGEEFINEVATISRTSHINIVSLLGFCYEINSRALIYEFMPNGSLDKFLNKEGFLDAICDLDWNTFYKITIGIARGLEYLHQGCSTRILHLDIKPQNILLDENFCPKISDFGLAKICQKRESIVSVIGTRGTIGYIAPEIYSRSYGGVSHKCDVYSYGMLILDMIGGRKNYYNDESRTGDMYFPDWIYRDLEQGNLPKRCLTNTKEENDLVMKSVLVSLWCIQQNPSERPSMNKVVEMLEGPLELLPHPPKPFLCSPKRSSSQFSDISCSGVHGLNSIAA